MLGLRFCARAFSSCSKRGPLFIAVRGPLTIVASLVAEHRLQTRRLSSCGSGAQLPRGMWDLPRPGLEPVSPALAGRLSTTAPPGKPNGRHFRRRWGSPVLSCRSSRCAGEEDTRSCTHSTKQNKFRAVGAKWCEQFILPQGSGGSFREEVADDLGLEGCTGV